MRKSNIFLLALLLTLAGLLVLSGCGGTSETVPDVEPVVEEVEEVAEVEEEPEAELFGDALRGGLLYDKWWKPLGLDAPEGDHPLWSTQMDNTRSGADTWRCKECHGWDYSGADGAYASGSHFTGFSGIMSFSGGDANDALAALQGASNADHDFSTVMDEQALIDIALFMAEDMMDYSGAIADDKSATSSDLSTGETLYQDACTECHGPEGLAINFKSTVSSSVYVSGVANGNPWEFLHKVRFGHPGSEMPSAIDSGWTGDEQAAVLAYSQSLPESNFVTQGGLIYDKWWKALGLDAPTEDQALWATQTSNTRSGQDTWRCKECHGWDYSGADGAYATGSHFTGFPGVLAAQSLSLDEIAAWMDGTTNADHDFSAYFDADAMAMITGFLQTGTVDMSTYINEEKTANGDTSVGNDYYEIACTSCHGDDGRAISFGGKFVGTLANGNPWETLHKSAFGQPGEGMPSGINLGWSWQDLSDLLSFMQTLPVE